MTRPLSALLLAAALAGPAAAQKLAVTAGPQDQANVVVYAPLPAGTPDSVNVVELPDGTHAPAQVAAPPLVGTPAKGKTLAFVLPALKAGQSVTVRPATLTYTKAPPHFTFKDESGRHADLLFGGRPVLRFVNAPHDPAEHYLTFKPFHQVFDPAEGKVLLSSGTHKTAKDGQFPHHRGMFFGFNKVTYGDNQTADVWHGSNNVFSQADTTTALDAGEVLGRQRAAISWHGKDGKTFATEAREVTAYHVPGGTLLDWQTVLTTAQPKVRLDGDPQHAGFHFRASQEVAKSTAKQTYYLRPDGKDEPGKTRNWPGQKDHVNLPWAGMSFVVGGKRYTAVRINHPDNPKDARASERDYGRFGDYFEYDLTPTNPLKLKYRVWVQEGETTVEQCAAMAAAFAAPPAVTEAK